MTPAEEGRLKRLMVTDTLITDLFAPGDHPAYRIVADGVPDGATLVGFSLCEKTGVVELKYAHESFSVVLGGCVIPTLSLKVQRADESPQPEIVLPRGKSSNYTGPTTEQLPPPPIPPIGSRYG